MIVRVTGERLQLITQPDHARLSGRIMAHCVALAEHPRRATILRAVAEHDAGWADEDAAPAVDPVTGTLVDFVTAPFAVRQRVWPRSIARLGDDAWAAALVAQHALTVYERFRSEEEWAPFFAARTRARDERLAAAGLPLDTLVSDYVFVRLGDLLSLAFCAGWTSDQQFGGYTVRAGESAVRVSPDLFGGETIAFSIATREIPNTRYASDRALQTMLRRTAATTRRGEVLGGG